ncbi:SWIRM domain-containing protein KNAG_0D04950 [Huiozyma naganishii CBS 8797]|uniref:SWIRM domain-containing protein n=1 Tax=Huiozyma naganishii (strain ATCC MYA-139 / BCRC 22969 / CBS 8797 / KCTC 17520 / NBRC 10181 / NCYC 3082 / Yp74L-3) TaxID=1071383 RepID=J7S671_HUIN7|nr:hypothetical protein KNAG_0D04950 [Kazachstania naganishii CBS 8797]CCK70234.1 hypothetical protein KNAG_0D04950 [Kazachstania naganishii CBS 8797]
MKSHLQSPKQEFAQLDTKNRAALLPWSPHDRSRMDQGFGPGGTLLGGGGGSGSSFDAGRIDSMLEMENRKTPPMDAGVNIPSPPLSPKMVPLCHRDVPKFTDTQLGGHFALVSPNWPAKTGTQLHDYQRSIEDFCNTYRIFNRGEAQQGQHPADTSVLDTQSHNLRRSPTKRAKNYTTSGPATTSLNTQTVQNGGLRRYVVKKAQKQKHRKDQQSLENRPHKKQHYHHHVPHRPLTSPPPNLASASLVQKVPQYVQGTSWMEVPDHCPATGVLDHLGHKALRVEWKGSPLDLSADPLRDRLHPAELVLASILRLPVDLYLDSKRRLFLEKYCKVQRGLPFRRTDAQKACRIDVNKASRLYQAFEKVGWLDDKHFV